MTTLQAHQHGLPLDATDDQITQAGEQAVREKANTLNHVVTAPPVKVRDERAVFVDDGPRQGWLPVDGPDGVGPQYGPAEGRTVVWRAEVEQSPEAIPLEGTREDDGAVMFNVPTLIVAQGGAVRCMHRLGVPVTATAYKHNGEGIGIFAAFQMDPDEELVQVMPGTALLRVAAG